jgi:DNA (cytosine-5)-methyltransferase 1
MRKSFISLFAGVGGLDHGFKQAGWDCLYASDINAQAVSTLLANSDESTVVEQADVTELSGSDILARVGANRGEIPLLVGGPPCQSWSSAGHQLGWEDPRGRLFEDFVRLADETGVQYVMFENVRGLLTARGPDGQPGSALAYIRKQLLSRGFQTSVTLLNSADFGVPQRRVRLFVVGHRERSLNFTPLPTHDKLGAEGKALWITLGSCLEKIDPVRADEVVRPSDMLAEQLADIQPGSGVRSMGKAERTRPGGHWGYKQGAFIADLSAPARTVTANSQQDWIRDPLWGLRKLTLGNARLYRVSPPIGFGRRI